VVDDAELAGVELATLSALDVVSTVVVSGATDTELGVEAGVE